jgi:hypothetical protein
MKVDKAQFEAVVSKLPKTPPIKPSEAKTGQRKTGKTIAAQKPKASPATAPPKRFNRGNLW